jgi:hypothetical protein
MFPSVLLKKILSLAEKPGILEYYEQLVYGLSFYDLVTEKFKIKESYFVPISGFLVGLLMGIFGKEYGLLGTYTNNITKLNFLINCYVLSAFFGITGIQSYKKLNMKHDICLLRLY